MVILLYSVECLIPPLTRVLTNRQASFLSKIIIYDVLSCFISVDPLVGSIANQYINDRQEHDKIAKEWTKRFAT